MFKSLCVVCGLMLVVDCCLSMDGCYVMLSVERCSLFVCWCWLRVVKCCLMCVDRCSSLLVVGCVLFGVCRFVFAFACCS